MLGFIILLFIFFGIWVAMIGLADVEEVRKNWPKYRCKPNVMPFAALYGQNTAENFQFCLMNMFGQEMGTALGPVFQILGTIVGTLATLIQVANSLRVQSATMMGGVNGVFQNFADRFKQLLSAVQMSAYRVKLIMGRLYGAFFAMIYMSIAGMTAVQNFTETALFDFLDTFCFDPDTLVDIEGKGMMKVKDVKIGDIFVKTGSTVTSTFQFQADGQRMVELPGNITVSTNHYVYSLGKWIQAGEHPLAIQKGPWNGGNERPLICFNTSDHKIPIGHFIFLDYDETEEGDQQTMDWIESRLNAKSIKKQRTYEYTSCVSRSIEIRMKDGSTKSVEEISLGDRLSTGKVVGIVKKQGNQSCELPTSSKDCVAPGVLCWTGNDWVRAGDVLPIKELMNPETFYSFVVLKSAMLETKGGAFLRDYVEVHSPESEQFYAKKVESLPSCILAE
jgi:hypothetical protein